MMYFGYLPTMFDAPAKPHHPDGDWSAFTFLTAIPDLVVSRSLQALTGFRWGYRLASGRPTSMPVQPIGPDDWQSRLGLLTRTFPTWTFLDSTW